MRFRSALLASTFVLALLSGTAFAATNFVGPIQSGNCSSHNWVLGYTGTTGAAACAQPAVTDLANVTSGTVLGNATGSSAAPAATAAPVLGVASTTPGSVALYNSATAFAITIQNGGGSSNGATSAYNFNLPITVGTAGQALTSQGGGTTAMTWSNVVTSALTVVSKTTGYTLASAGADDWKRFDNTGAGGTVIFTMPTTGNLAAGDNWCFLVTAAQTLEILAAATETITMGNVTSAAAGNLQTNTVGSSVCIYMESTTTAYVWAALGAWALT